MNDKIIVQIPARGGSKRVPKKNLKLMAGKPMIAYAITAALDAELDAAVIVNTDSQEIGDTASKFGAGVYMRKSELASDSATGDEFTYDFLMANPCDILIMVNPVCPLISSEQILRCLDAFRESQDADTLITCEETQMQCAVDSHFVNIDPKIPLRPSQENARVQILNWAVTIWDAKKYVERYEATGSAYIGEKRVLFPIEKLSGVKVSEPDDFRLAEAIILSRATLP